MIKTKYGAIQKVRNAFGGGVWSFLFQTFREGRVIALLLCNKLFFEMYLFLQLHQS